MTYGSMPTAGQTVTQTARRANKKTNQNISKLKTYFSKHEAKSRPIFK